MKHPSYQYPGAELELFRDATNWKKYFADVLRPYIKGDVAETGAGIGANTPLLLNTQCTSWLLIEPDDKMFQHLQQQYTAGKLPAPCTCFHGTLSATTGLFDCILYIDVLEHIEQDNAELEAAFSRLRPGGRLIVLSPAFNHLYNPFDKAIGHFRRYTKKSLKAIAPEKAALIHCRYYDSLGYLAALANTCLLKQHLPQKKQVLFWDRILIPASRILDKLLLHSAGKTIIAVWQQNKTEKQTH